MSEQPEVRMAISIDPAMRGGVFADVAMVWHNEHGFTIDFLAPDPTGQAEDGTITQPATVVSRVRLPVSVMFQLARAISENVSTYEARYGKIPAGGPDHPPEEQA